MINEEIANKVVSIEINVLKQKEKKEASKEAER